jgi:hypothetical protein
VLTENDERRTPPQGGEPERRRGRRRTRRQAGVPQKPGHGCHRLFLETAWSVSDPVTGGRDRAPWRCRAPALPLTLTLPLKLSLLLTLRIVVLRGGSVRVRPRGRWP